MEKCFGMQIEARKFASDNLICSGMGEKGEKKKFKRETCWIFVNWKCAVEECFPLARMFEYICALMNGCLEANYKAALTSRSGKKTNLNQKWRIINYSVLRLEGRLVLFVKGISKYSASYVLLSRGYIGVNFLMRATLCVTLIDASNTTWPHKPLQIHYSNALSEID